MSYRDQKTYFEFLPRYINKFSNEERMDFEMLLKRHKDDEDLDKLALGRLKTMYEKYHINRPKKNWDHVFKKPENKD